MVIPIENESLFNNQASQFVKCLSSTNKTNTRICQKIYTSYLLYVRTWLNPQCLESIPRKTQAGLEHNSCYTVVCPSFKTPKQRP